MRRRGLSRRNGRCGVHRLRGENATRRPSNSRVLMAGVVCGEMEGGWRARSGRAARVARLSTEWLRLSAMCSSGLVGCARCFARRATAFGCVHDCCRLVRGGLSLRRRRVVPDAVRLVAVGASLRGGKGGRKVHRFSSKTEGFLSKVEAFFREGRGLRAERRGSDAQGAASWGAGRPSSRGEGAIVEWRADYRWSRGVLIR